MPTLQRSAPHFFVRDVVASVKYYQRVFGFTCDKLWGDPPRFAMPQRDELVIMLNEAEASAIHPNGRRERWDAYFWVSGVDELCAEFKAHEARIVYGPEDRSWYGMREFAVKDPDGYLIAFGEAMGEKSGQ